MCREFPIIGSHRDPGITPLLNRELLQKRFEISYGFPRENVF